MMAYCWKWNLNALKLMAGQAMPGVVQKTIERALEPDGYRERKMLLQHIVPSNDLATTTNSKHERTDDADQYQGFLEIPRVEDDNVVDAAFRDLRDE